MIVRLFARTAAAAVLLGATVHAPLEAQVPQRRELLRTPDGVVLDFHPDGVWRKRARDVAHERARLITRRDYPALNAPLTLGAAGAPTAGILAAVSGTWRLPTVLFRFQDHGTGAVHDTSEYGALLFGDAPPGTRPYTITTLYRQMSNGLLDLAGTPLGWVTLDSVEETYTGPAGACPSNPPTNNCNGLFGVGLSSMLVGLREALTKLDATVDFGQFDSDGPDGLPNSGDDDGFVDLILFLHSERDGSCGGSANNHIWAHKYTMSGFTSDDPAAAGGMIRFRDYIVQSGVGGSTGCDSTQIMPIGTTAHELGHGLGLPDLYDVSGTGSTEGVGEWDLMGSGNWSTQQSPSRMSAWSLNELGWVTLQEISATGSYTLSPATLDTTWLLRPPVANPRGEYLLLENRQPLESDSAMIRVHCDRSGLPFPTACGGGLAVWHIDSLRLASGGGVNTGSIHGVALIQADGLNNLRQPTYNRGDGGDLWPGVTGNRRFSYRTLPAAVLNAGGYVGFELDSIAELVDGRITFRLEVGGLTSVLASDSAVPVRVDGVLYPRFEDVLEPGTTHSVDVDSIVTSGDGRTRWTFASWSDGGARAHDFTATTEGVELVASIATTYRVRAIVTGAGTVTAAPAGPVESGSFYDRGSTVRLIAQPGDGRVFDRWVGDITSLSDTLVLASLSRPYDVEARFLGPPTVALDRVVDHLLGVGTTLTSSDERYFDLIGNRNNRFDVGDFLAWLEVSGATGSVAAQEAVRALRGGEPPATSRAGSRK